MRRIITVGREFGSGGREIGRRIAEELQIAYYDQEIITEIAKRTALSEAYIRQIEEKRPVVSFPIHIGHSFYLSPDPTFHPDLSIYTKQHDLLYRWPLCGLYPPRSEAHSYFLLCRYAE